MDDYENGLTAQEFQPWKDRVDFVSFLAKHDYKILLNILYLSSSHLVVLLDTNRTSAPH